MGVRLVEDDGSTRDITGLVTAVYEALWEGTRFHKDWKASDVERFAELARLLGHRSAELATEIAAQVRQEERAEQQFWGEERRQRAEQVVAALAELS